MQMQEEVVAGGHGLERRNEPSESAGAMDSRDEGSAGNAICAGTEKSRRC